VKKEYKEYKEYEEFKEKSQTARGRDHAGANCAVEVVSDQSVSNQN